MQQPLTRQGVMVFRPVQLEQCHILLKNLLSSPEHFEAHIRRYLQPTVPSEAGTDRDRRFTSAITLEMTYGHKVSSDDDAYLHIADRVNIVSTKMSKAAILDLFPSGTLMQIWFGQTGIAEC
ncbi:uncharacterized protein PHACADRAFT_256621 [Phanerochaete carnosa HHB-10118-sp]|uniref:Uncharacterized protein n=1 Tax=Phanerochaete carnosa (strain HHB-10118-sp) TaxID=650164 RepID=K5WZ33_PHACS|nr:uncharacterized protein PHACADRAFT_256621 [Phanerochaete carnosa HHB-10118-sp]EKM55762.1 hypothetical protein PHACADRAFT_256621 [Phanerochaete carnosa HHB-10118-sp]